MTRSVPGIAHLHDRLQSGGNQYTVQAPSNTGIGYYCPPPAPSIHDWYGRLLCITLAGYAIFGKGFAYIGLPPLFIGEVIFLLGIIVIIRSDCWIAMLASMPSFFLLMLISLAIFQVALSVGPYGLDAARDGVVILYGLFAFVVISLLLERPERFLLIVALYSRFALLYGFVGGALITASGAMDASGVLGSLMPRWPNSGIELIHLRLGEGASHLAGAAAFVLLGLRRVNMAWVFIMVLSVGIISLSRGALLAFLAAVSLAGVIGRHRKRFGSVLLVGGLLFGVAYAADIRLPMSQGRSIGAVQIVEGLGSIVGSSKEANLDGTKTWRLNWWEKIVGYTFKGPFFWTGKGFGMNLAEEDGFVVGTELGGPPVRSPHNANMTILARLGVPGFFLWIATCGVWFGTLFRTMATARRRGDHQWADIILWIACYGAAIIVDSSFDVALEGPMLGIWFWCLFGFGIGSTMLYRAKIQSDLSTATKWRQRTVLAGHQS